MRLGHHSNNSDATSCTNGLSLKQRSELVFVTIWNRSQNIYDLGHSSHLVLRCDFSLELREVDWLTPVVSLNKKLHDLSDSLNSQCVIVYRELIVIEWTYLL